MICVTLITFFLLIRQVRMKHALDRAIAERSVSLAQLQATFAGMVEPALLTDRNANVVAMNSAYLTLFEFETPPKTGEQLLAHFEFTTVDGSPLDDTQSPFTRAMRGEVVRNMELKGRNKKTGTIFHILTGAAPVRGADGSIEAVVITSHDITEKKRIAEQLQQNSKMEAIGRLAGGIAHDLNNVLQVIVSYAHLMQETGATHNDLQEIIQASTRAADMTGRLLAFSRQQGMKPKLIIIDRHIEEESNFIRRLLTDQVRLELRLTAGASRVLIDPGHLDQILMNLAANASQAMPQGGRLVLETRVSSIDKQSHPTLENRTYVTLSVTDNGVGMSDEVRARIFEPFFSTKKEQGGTGLGLAIVYGIIKQSRGDIFVYSEPGSGTSFHIYLPEAAAVGEELVKPEMALPAPGPGRERIVLIEDDLQILQLVERSLRQANYDVWAASDARTAIEYVRTHPGVIDLIITDVLMPEMNGRELAEAIGHTEPKIRILFMSGFPGDMQQAFLPPHVDFLPKPFSTATLIARIQSIMTR